MVQFNSGTHSENGSVLSKQRKKTGPSPKYGPDQAKKMVSMRLSPDALSAIKTAAEKVFRDSQADVVEKMMRYFSPEILLKVFKISNELNISPEQVLEDSLTLLSQSKKIKTHI
ncbi:MAG: hypothetical protein SFT81_04405 [Candidatus Caenarcaniphilales bacterium]|nr:hypothetical protein [Candidatus Caenarcaniphilales bacterium]